MPGCYECGRTNTPLRVRSGHGGQFCDVCNHGNDQWAKHWRDIELERAFAAARRKGLVA